MTIRGSANQSIKTNMTSGSRSESREIGPDDDKGGYRKGSEGTVEYRLMDNDPDGTSAGMQFTSGGDHLPWDKPQADRLPV